MTKIDFKKELKHLYNPSAKKVEIVDIPMLNFLMIDGSGDPNTAQEYKDAVEGLFAVSYALKFMVKKEKGVDYGVLPLEGLWWTDNMTQFSLENKDAWKWTSMIMQPEYVTEALVNKALEQVEKKKNPPALPKIRFKSFQEGLSAQIMHIGPYSAEGPTIEGLHNYIKEHGYGLRGKHHEIYLSDPRRSAPERMKTVIRQPMK
ncbi:MAG: GyrI-like domain-containing protein [Candidatus Bathyarchaeota archaeon]|nr:MAG: GyrI-like domain-containing protein [Candidatus Bathyarchaeota archaeon]